MATAKLDMQSAIERRMQNLHGIPDSRGKQGILSRGANIYKGTSAAANRGHLVKKKAK